MHRRVFILGAGFSRPAGLPLATELTDAVEQWFDNRNLRKGPLFEYAPHLRTVHQRLTRSNTLPALNIEEFYEYAAVYAERLRMDHHCSQVGRKAGDTSYQEGDDLENMLSYVDHAIQAVLLTREADANLKAIDQFVSRLRPQDTVVTFNYDRLVETCLTRRNMNWSFGIDDVQPDALRVLKLHGSIDWICFQRGYSRNSSFQQLFAKRDMKRERDGGSNAPCGEHEYDYTLHRVPPDQLNGEFKHQGCIQGKYFWGLAGIGPHKRVSLIPGLGVVWERARRALYRADHIVVVGFSLSPFDRLAQIEFARVAQTRDADGVCAPRVTVVDPALIRSGGQLQPSGACLLERVQSVFYPATPVEMNHEDFDWSTLD